MAFALGLEGFGLQVSFGPAGSMATQVSSNTLSSYSLSVLRLTGNLVNHSGLSRSLAEILLTTPVLVLYLPMHMK